MLSLLPGSPQRWKMRNSILLPGVRGIPDPAPATTRPSTIRATCRAARCSRGRVTTARRAFHTARKPVQCGPRWITTLGTQTPAGWAATCHRLFPARLRVVVKCCLARRAPTNSVAVSPASSRGAAKTSAIMFLALPVAGDFSSLSSWACLLSLPTPPSGGAGSDRIHAQ